jgi:hypothetical protein
MVAQLCTDGEKCTRRVCFFAHREKELRSQPVDPAGADSTDQATPSGAETLQSAGGSLKRVFSSERRVQWHGLGTEGSQGSGLSAYQVS